MARSTASINPGPAVLGLIAHRSAARPYTLVLPRDAVKNLASRMAQAALAGFALNRIEGDAGTEEFIATRGHETLRFGNVLRLDSWLDHFAHEAARH